jgi:hypothetical protein
LPGTYNLRLLSIPSDDLDFDWEEASVSYPNTITALDFSEGVGDVRVSARYAWTVLGHIGPVSQNTESKQEAVTPLDAPANIFQPAPHTFSSTNNLIPAQPGTVCRSVDQEVPCVPSNTVWLFRSGEFTAEPLPASPIEVILAQRRKNGVTACHLDGYNR